MSTYILILLAVVFCHFVFIDHLSKAMQEQRLKIVKGVKDLEAMDAPAWLIDMWVEALPVVMFGRGKLKYVVFHYRKQKTRDLLAVKVKEIKALPKNIHELHKTMDLSAAFLMMSNSPYFSLLLVTIGLIRQSQLSIKSAVPHQESRAAMVVG